MSEGFKVEIPGPFTLHITFSLIKDGREDAGNLLADASREYKQSFDTLDAALQTLDQAVDRAMMERGVFDEEAPISKEAWDSLTPPRRQEKP